MRIWDISAGYLNRQSLLGEHRELHGLYSILINGKKGYSHHPETIRWIGHVSGLARRHAMLVAEMHLRGYLHHSPVPEEAGIVQWPKIFVTKPAEQFQLLKTKYSGKNHGRIPLPRSAQELWAQHKYSVMARDLNAYHAIGRRVVHSRHGENVIELAEELVTLLRQDPPSGGVVNAIEHMWGHVSHEASPADKSYMSKGIVEMLVKTQELAMRIVENYILQSTALSELMIFL